MIQTILTVALLATSAMAQSQSFSLNGIPQNSPKSSDSGVCKITNTDVDGNYHVSIAAEEDESTIAYLTATIGKDNQLIFNSFPYNQGDKITRTQIWVGYDADDIPLKSTGHIDHEAFPYMECNSTGVPTFEILTDEVVDCHTDTLTVVAFVEIMEPGSSKTHIKSQKVFMEIDTACDGDCTTDNKSGGICEEEEEMGLVSNKKKECHSIVAGSQIDSMRAGEVCVQVIGDVLDVVFTADDDWSLIRSQVWVGQELAANASSSLEGVPRKKSGAPDTRKFTNFECDWKGMRRNQFEIDLKYHCKNEEQYKITVVAHSTVEQVDKEGKPIAGTELDVFAFEHDADDTDSPWYGWFDFMIGCKCPTTKKFPAPPKDTPSPTPSPTTGTPTSSPSAHPSFAVTSVGTLVPTDTPTISASEVPTITASEVPTITASEVPTITASEVPTITASDAPSYSPSASPSGTPTEAPLCLESDDDPWDALCFPLMATEAWKPDAGQVCISMAQFGTGHMNVSFVLHEQSFWTLWEANVWIGSESEAQDIPRDDFGNIDTSLFPFKEIAQEGMTQMDVKSMVAYECEAGMEYASMTLIAHATVAEQCIPPNGTYIQGSNFDAYGVDGSLSSETDAYIAIPITVNCNCMETPTTEVPSEAPSVAITASPTETPLCMMDDNDSWDMQCYPLMATDAWKPEAGQVCISMSEYGTGKMNVTYTLDTSFWSIWEAQVWIGESLSTVPRNEQGKIDPSLFPYEVQEDGVNQTTVETVVEYACEGDMEYVELTLLAHSLVGEQCLPPNGTYLKGSEQNAYGVDVSKDAASEEYLALTFKVDCNCVELPTPPPKVFPTPPKDTSAPTPSPSATPSAKPSITASSPPTITASSSPTGSPTKSPTDPPTTPPTSAPSDSPTKKPTEGPTPSPSYSPSSPPTPTPSDSPTGSPTKKPTDGPTPSPSETPSAPPSQKPTDGPTPSPSATPTGSPTKKPTDGPTPSPSYTPSASPSSPPTKGPTSAPSDSPTESPTKKPTDGPTPSPSTMPSGSPSSPPTKSPTDAPTKSPTKTPSASPSSPPTGGPTGKPSASPSYSPTSTPTAKPTSSPSDSPTSSPTASPTKGPTKSPTDSPTASPSKTPTSSPTDPPTKTPTKTPTSSPTASPSKTPTGSPTKGPTKSPTDSPTASPSKTPTSSPTDPPTKTPTASPTKTPTGSPSKGPTGFPTIAPTTGGVDTCVDTATFGNNGCFNLTAYGYTGIPPPVDWEGYFCVKMTTSEQLEVTFSSVSTRKMWFASVWAGTDLATIPMLDDGINPDTNNFPWGDKSVVVEQAEYTTTVNLDSVASCAASASATYNLKLAAFAEFGDPCVPPTGNFIWNSDQPVWAQDVDNFQDQNTAQYTWLEIPITCDCVPATRRLQEIMDSPLMLRGSEFGELDAGFQEVDRSGWTPSGRSLRRRS